MNYPARFEEHFQRVVQLEGGFILHKNPKEKEMTYAGIYRSAYPNWEGWHYIDRGEIPPTELVRRFYYENFYKALEPIEDDEIRFSIFEFAVNAGFRKVIKIAQAVLGVTIDGILGPKTLSALNSANPEDFKKSFLIARIKYYLELSNRDPKRYGIYLRGWLNRAFKAIT